MTYNSSDHVLKLRKTHPIEDGQWYRTANSDEQVSCYQCKNKIPHNTPFIRFSFSPINYRCAACLGIDIHSETDAIDKKPNTPNPIDKKPSVIINTDWIRMEDGSCYHCNTNKCYHLKHIAR